MHVNKVCSMIVVVVYSCMGLALPIALYTIKYNNKV